MATTDRRKKEPNPSKPAYDQALRRGVGKVEQQAGRGQYMNEKILGIKGGRLHDSRPNNLLRGEVCRQIICTFNL